MAKTNKPKPRTNRTTGPITHNPSASLPQARKNGQSLAITATRTESFSGPIPPPDLLAKYNDALPNGADRIVSMAEKQQDHRISMEKFMAHEMTSRSKTGLYLGFVLALVIISGGIFLIYSGKNIEGLGLLIFSIATLVGIFIGTRSKQSAELESKSKNPSESS